MKRKPKKRATKQVKIYQEFSESTIMAGEESAVGAVDGDKSVVAVTSKDSAHLDIPKLKGANYLNWKSVMEDLIELKGLESVIFEKKDSKELNLRAKILLKSALDEKHLAEVRSYGLAHEIWSHLSRMCIGANSNDVAMLVRQFYTYVYQPGDDMNTHLEKLSTMKLQLETVKQGPTDEVFIDRILQTLPEQYQKLKDNWDYLHTDQKTVAELKSRAIKIEHELKQSEQVPAVRAFLSGKPNKYGQQKFKNQSIEERKKITNCSKCGIRGHWARECHTKPENYANKRIDKARANRSEPDQRAQDKEIMFMAGELSQTQSIKQQIIKLSQQDGSIRDLWIADSGATTHMCNKREWFKNLDINSSPSTVRVGDNGETEVLGQGQVQVTCRVAGRNVTVTINKVLLVPNIATNLLSIGQIDERGIKTVFVNQKVELIKQDMTVAQGIKLNNNLYLMDMVATKATDHKAMFCQVQRTMEDWHRALGHANPARILKLQKDKEHGMRVSNPEKVPDCSDCPPGKGRHASHPSLTHKASAAGERIHIDLSGIIGTASVSGSKYFMLCKDEWSSYTYVYCLEDKTQTTLNLAKFLAKFEEETTSRVKRIQTDFGSEFVNKRNEILFALERVVHETTAPYTPQQNGTVEREMQTIVNMARTMLQASKLPTKLWDEAIKTACFIKNRLPNSSTDKTPYELVRSKKPKMSHLCEFGRQVHVMIDGHHLSKFEPRTEPGYIVGFTNRTNTYRIYLKKSERVTESCNVIFKPHSETEPSFKPNIDESRAHINVEDPVKPSEPQNDLLDDFFSQYLRQDRQDAESVYHDTLSVNDEEEDLESPAFSPLTQDGNDSTSTTDQQEVPLMIERANLHIANEVVEPKSYQEALNGANKQDWLTAIEEELAAHEINRTWTVVRDPGNRKLLTTRWVFKIKTNTKGEIERFKARLVVRGYEQVEGYDFFETFSPVARYDSIRALIAIAAQFNLTYTQFDVQTAFLNGYLEEQVYTSVPEGLKLGTNKALKLNKGLYGLKQAPRVWSNTFKQTIERYGFKSLHSDTCVFQHQEKKLILCIYVDDGLLFARDVAQLREPIEYLKNAFKIREMSGSTFVGLEIERTVDGYFIHQTAFAKKILERFQMGECML